MMGAVLAGFGSAGKEVSCGESSDIGRARRGITVVTTVMLAGFVRTGTVVSSSVVTVLVLAGENGNGFRQVCRRAREVSLVYASLGSLAVVW